MPAIFTIKNIDKFFAKYNKIPTRKAEKFFRCIFSSARYVSLGDVIVPFLLFAFSSFSLANVNKLRFHFRLLPN